MLRIILAEFQNTSDLPFVQHHCLIMY